MKTMKIVVRSKVSAEKIEPWKSTHPRPNHYGLIIDGNCDVYSSNGIPIILMRRGCFTDEELEEVRKPYREFMRYPSDARAAYAGYKQSRVIKKDGTLSKSERSLDENGRMVSVYSSIGGFYESVGGRFPYCRATTYTRDHPEEWAKIAKHLRKCSRIYKSLLPNFHEIQTEFANKAHPAWVVPGTPFSTISVNNTVCAAYHQDSGDLKEGFGCMFAMRHGDYSGFELVLPEFSLAVNMRHGDFILFNPAVWHGNIPPKAEGKKNKDWYRVSVVMYLRNRILGCLSPEEELKRAKKYNTRKLESL